MISNIEYYDRFCTFCTVTSIADPNRIFISFKNSDNLAALGNMENEIAAYFRSRFDAGIRCFGYPKENDFVAFFHPTWLKYIRAVVDFILTDTYGLQTFICWAIDYGMPVRTTEVANLLPLPAKFRMIDSTIIEACLPVQPIFNQNIAGSTNRSPQWTRECIHRFNSTLHVDVSELKFNEIARIDGRHYGHILFQKYGESRIFSAAHTLIGNGYAVCAGNNLAEFTAGMCKVAKNRRQNVECRKISGICHCDGV